MLPLLQLDMMILTLYADQAELNFELIASAVQMSELEVLASRASEKTAVAYTDVSKDEIALSLVLKIYLLQ